jgi:NADPH-dependent glutamate synthase beta subunit-like oxidoreductase/NAD(P)H-flavin reductase
MNSTTEKLTLHIDGFDYYDLHKPEKLKKLTSIFFDEVRSKNPTLAESFSAYQVQMGEGLSPAQSSALLVEMAPYLSDFIARLFGVENECKKLKIQAEKEKIIFDFKREFFTRRVLKKFNPEQARLLDIAKLDREVAALRKGITGMPDDDFELETAAMVMELLNAEKPFGGSDPKGAAAYFKALAGRLHHEVSLRDVRPASTDEATMKNYAATLLSIWEQWTAAHYFNETAATKRWVTFKQPEKVDFDHLVERIVLNTPVPNMNIGREEEYRHREGFDLTDPRFSRREAMSEVDYCIICHERGKDSCSKGFHDGAGYKKNPLDYELAGCPLDQKISESHLLQSKGDTLAALSIITIDNPMCPGTGHRICNDCMKACIYQKQEPVNIPEAETRILTDVLSLPWGFEIYSLLTRWNPLNIERPYQLPYNGKKILIVGMGPAGYTLAHYFLNEGFGIVGIDGLKIEPLPAVWVGDTNTPFQPIKDITEIQQKLSERILLGFGGVSEYGITVRWDKNFLTIMYINLLRRAHYRLYDGVRFGGTLTVEDAWDLGFDHVCIASGAGKPTIVSMKNNLIRGIRKASDFLMALQLTGAGRKDSIANLQVQLPAIVIGGGLTAIDTATELIAYYPIQVTKIKQRYDALCELRGKDAADKLFDPEETAILQRFLAHAAEIEQERDRARQAEESPNFIPLIRKWGGVHLYYRKSLNDSPAYRLNHEEVIKSFEEGITFVENMSPVEAVTDEYGAVKELVFQQMKKNEKGKWIASNDVYHIPARTVMVAAGTVPNIMYEKEYPNTFELDERKEFFKSFAVKQEEEPELVEPESDEIGFFTSYEKGGKFVSYYGDNHPVFEGNVVKAMASAKNGFKKVSELFREGKKNYPPAPPNGLQHWNNLVKLMDHEFKPYVVRVERLTSTIVEVVVHAPRAARKFQPGQFYRLQNYEHDSPRLNNTLLMMEGLALTGAWVDKEKGLLSLIVLEMGSSSRLVRFLKPGQRVVVMGPTGTPTEITKDETVILLGGGLGNAVLFSIAKAFKEQNNKVIYFAGYKKGTDIFKQDEVEANTDVVVYSVDSGEAIKTRRPQDKSFVGNIIQAMLAYSKGELGTVPIPLNKAERIIAIGSDRMMAAVTAARHTVLKPYLNEKHVGIASINSPMQCMMKAICAQCVQRQINQKTKQEEFVFTCVNQDQCMDEVDFGNLNARLRVNSLMEKLSDKWVEHVVKKNNLVGV